MDEQLQHILLRVALNADAIAPARASMFRYVRLTSDNSWSLVEDTILKNRIRLSRANAFNDPFEASPHIVNDLSRDELYDFLNFALKSFFKDSVPFTFKDGRISDATGSYLDVTQVEEFATKAATEALLEKFREIEIASFCARISSQLLWAHYADGYKGIAYHFIVSGEPKRTFRHLRPIKYTRQRPIIPISEIVQTLRPSADLPKPQKAILFDLVIDRFFRQKSIEWAYEEEFRIVSVGSEKIDIFPPQELASIILGPLFPRADEEKLFAILKKRERPLRAYRSELSKTDYSVGVNWDSPIVIG